MRMTEPECRNETKKVPNSLMFDAAENSIFVTHDQQTSHTHHASNLQSPDCSHDAPQPLQLPVRDV